MSLQLLALSRSNHACSVRTPSMTSSMPAIAELFSSERFVLSYSSMRSKSVHAFRSTPTSCSVLCSLWAHFVVASAPIFAYSFG